MEMHYTEGKVTNRTVKTVPFYKNLVKVYDTREVIINGKLDSNHTTVFITSEDKIQNVEGLTDISNRVYVENLYGNYAVVVMVAKETYKDILAAKKFVYDDNIFEDYDDEKYTNNPDAYMLVLWNWSSYELTDLDGVFLPLPVHCSYDYSNGRITNANYDLNEIVTKLNNDERVFAIQKERYKPNYGERVPLSITDIPYYNATDLESLEVDFYVLPTTELFTEMQAIKNQFDRVPWLLEKMFGIKKRNI